MLPVNEIFETIQGEARYTGTPSVFVRLQGCPVGCPWCDTKHTWYVEPENKIDLDSVIAKTKDTDQYGAVSALELAQTLSKYKAGHVVITGGEPCLYDLRELTKRILQLGKTVQIETSGTHEINCHPESWVTLSPKIEMPGGYKVLQTSIDRADEIKFPVGKMKDVDTLKKHFINPLVKVWLQPLSQSKKATQLCIEQATINGWNLSIQTHKFIGIR
jgi:7-carboxy-7-deazaguanine synthase